MKREDTYESIRQLIDDIDRHIIEALRSGIPSRTVEQYFSEAQPKIMKRFQAIWIWSAMRETFTEDMPSPEDFV